MERKRFLKLWSMSSFSPPTCALTLPGNATLARAFCAFVETVCVSVEVIRPVTVTALSPSTRLTAAGESTSLTPATSPTVVSLATGRPRTSSSVSTEVSGTPTTTGVFPSVVTVLLPRSEPSEVGTSAGESPAFAAFSGSTLTSTSGLPPERSHST
jgi:hypothetical protein